VRALLDAPNLARLAYIGLDGRPRVVPIWFAEQNGDIIMVTGPKAEKARALEKNGAVAVTIDSAQPPYKVLLIDGDADLEPVEGMAPEYRPIVERYLGPAAEAYLGQLLPRVKRQVRIRIKVRSHRIFDFVKRYPKSLS
jgi:PPOX class probable F420-dependent enzyme